MSDLYLFDELSKDAWIEKYKPHIRTSLDWDALGKDPDVLTDLCFYTAGDKVRTVWYEEGSWRNGKVIRLGPEDTGWSVLRVPGVEFRGEITILDGNHRLRDVKPYLLVVDTLVVTEDQARYFTDLFSKGMLT